MYQSIGSAYQSEKIAARQASRDPGERASRRIHNKENRSFSYTEGISGNIGGAKATGTTKQRPKI
jgi:hypothetical protein